MNNTKNNSRTFRTRISSRATADVGAVDYTLTDTITETAAGLTVTTTARGMCEGARVNETSTSSYLGVSMDRAAAYRLSHGYHEVTSKQ